MLERLEAKIHPPSLPYNFIMYDSIYILYYISVLLLTYKADFIKFCSPPILMFLCLVCLVYVKCRLLCVVMYVSYRPK